MRIRIRTFARISAIFVVLLLTVTLVIHSDATKAYLARRVEAYLQSNYGIPLRIGSLNYEFFPLHAQTSGVVVYSDASRLRKAVELPTLKIRAPYSILWSKAGHIQEVRAKISYFNFANLPRAAWNKIAQAHLEVDRASIQTESFASSLLNFQDVSIDATAHDRWILLKNLSAKTGSTSLHASGAFTPSSLSGKITYNIRGEIADVARVQRSGFPLHGAFIGRGVFVAKRGKLHVRGDASSDSLSLRNSAPFTTHAQYVITDLKDLSLDLQWTSLPLSSFTPVSSLASGTIHYTGGFHPVNGDGAFQVFFQSDGHRWSPNGMLQGTFDHGVVHFLPGKIELQAKPVQVTTKIVSGSFDLIHSNGSVNLQGAVRKGALWTTVDEGRIRIAPNLLHLDVRGRLPQSSYVATGAIPFAPNQALQIHATAQTNAAILSSFFPTVEANGNIDTKVDVQGSRRTPELHIQIQGDHMKLAASKAFVASDASAHIDVSGANTQISSWRGKAEFKAAEFAMGNLHVAQPPPLVFAIREGVLTMQQVNFRYRDFLQVKAGGDINMRNGTLAMNVDGAADLKTFSKPNMDTVGKLSAAVKIGGSLSTPKLQGAIKLTDGRFRTSLLPYAMNDAHGEADLTGDGLFLKSAFANFAGGSIQMGGRVDLSGWKFLPDLWMRARGIGINYPEDVRSAIDADLTITSNDGSLQLQGDVDLARCVISRNITEKERNLISSTLAKFDLASSGVSVPIPIQLHLTSRDAVRVNNRLGTIAADVNLLLHANGSNANLKGEVNVREGSVLFLQTRQFFVERGKIQFDGTQKLTPHLDLVLRSTIRDDETKRIYEVSLPIRGPMDDLQDVAPKSSPALLPPQIYFLLLTGRSSGQLTQSEARFMRQQLVSYYSGQTVLPVPEKIPSNQWLNAVEIHPELISSERDPAHSFVNGKNFFAGVRLLYSLPLSQPEEQTWIADFRAKKHLTVRLVDHQDGSYSSSLEQRFRLGGSKRSESETRGAGSIGTSKIAKAPAVTQHCRALNFVFDGYQPPSDRIKEYQRWYQEGFNGNALQGLIQHDLLAQLWREGFHSSEVQSISSNTFQIKPGQRQSVAISWIGADQIPSSELKKELISILGTEQELNADALHDFAALQNAIQIVYLRKGFVNAGATEGESDIDPNRTTIRKSIIVSEGRRALIRDVSTSRNGALPTELISQLKLRSGKVYDPGALQEDEFTIGRYYENLGYRNVDIKGSAINQNDALNLQYELKLGTVAKIEAIEIQGNRATSSSAILGALPFRAGEPLIQQRLAEAQKRLHDLDLFRSIEVRAAQTKDPRLYRVIVRVEEAGPYEIAYGGGYNSEKKLEGTLQLSNRNLFGGGQSLSLIAKANSQDRIGRLVYHVPDFTGLKWKNLIAASYEETARPLFSNISKGFEMQRQFHIKDPFVLVAGYRFDHVAVSPNAAIPGDLRSNLSRLEIILLSDSRNDPISPLHGTLISLQSDAAPAFLGSQISFVKNYSQFYHYQSFGKIVWASGVRLGIGHAFDKTLFPTERFFAGGSFSLRGFEQDRVGPFDAATGLPIGGEGVFIFNQELRFPIPIHPWLGAAVFYDAGNVYFRTQDFNPLDLRHSAGFGLRLNTPVGLVRFDWGVNLQPKLRERRSVFHIALGQAF